VTTDILYGTPDYKECLKLLTNHKTNRWARLGKRKGGNLDNLNDILNYFEPALKHRCRGQVRKIGTQGVFKDSNNQIVKVVHGHFIADGVAESWEAYVSSCIYREGLNWLIKWPSVKYRRFNGQYISYVWDLVMITIDAKRLFEIGLNNHLNMCYVDSSQNQVFSLRECFDLGLVFNYFEYDGEMINGETPIKERKSREFQQFKLRSGIKADYVIFVPLDDRPPYLEVNKKKIYTKLVKAGCWGATYHSLCKSIQDHTARALECKVSQRPNIIMENGKPLGFFIDNGVVSPDQIIAYKKAILNKVSPQATIHKSFFRNRLRRIQNGIHNME
jgi:hypothetical protein